MGADLRPPLANIPPYVVAVADYEDLARDRMTGPAWAWLQGGAADETTLFANRNAFGRLELVPRVLADMAGANTRLELFGQSYEHPVFLAPVAFQQFAHPEGELATVQAASAMGAGMVVSTQASIPACSRSFRSGAVPRCARTTGRPSSSGIRIAQSATSSTSTTRPTIVASIASTVRSEINAPARA